MIFECDGILNLISKTFRIIDIGALTQRPFIFCTNKKSLDKKCMNHESIHLAQQKEVGLLKWDYLYIKEYFKNRKIYITKELAYENISFEREAYNNENNSDYLRTREAFAWRKYL